MLCTAQFVVVLDVTIVAIALPAIGAGLDFTPAGLSWVITAYTVVLAGLLILGGRTADLAGAQRMFRAGLWVFSGASLACALAWAPDILIGARILQGVGAAVLSPAALAALTELTDLDGHADARRRALGWWTAAAAGGGASGWVLGGVITEVAGWRWVFAVNVPIGIGALLFSRTLPSPVDSGRLRRASLSALDLPGAGLVTVGVAAAALGLSRLAAGVHRADGWLVAALSVVALASFVRHERRAARPLVPPGLLGIPGVLGGNLTATALTASTTPAMLTAILYVQDTLRLSPARSGLLFPAFNLAVIGSSLLGPAVLRRVGARTLLLVGFAGIVAGIGALLTLSAERTATLTLLGAFAVMGFGLGAASLASTTAGTAEVPEGERGVAAGLLNSTAQLGSALGLAVTSPLVAAAAPMTGYRLGFVVAALIGVAGALAALRVPRSKPAGFALGRDATPGPARRATDAPARRVIE